MKMTPRIVLPALLLILLHGLFGWTALRRVAATDDENTVILSGLCAWKGDYSLNREVPHAMKLLGTMPLLAIDLWKHQPSRTNFKLQTHQNDAYMVYQADMPVELMLEYVRLMFLAISMAGCWFVFLWGTLAFGPEAGLASLAFWCLNPTVIGNAIIAKPDLALAYFLMMSALAFWCWMRRPQAKYALGVGLALGGALASKYFGFLFLPVYPVYALLENRWGSHPSRRDLIRGAIIGGLAAAVVIGIVYRFHYSDYWLGLQLGREIQRGQTMGALFGKEIHGGTALYYGLTLILKTPLALWIALLTGLGFWAKNLRRWPRESSAERRAVLDVGWIVVPAVAYFALLVLLSPYKAGARQVLPVILFMSLLAGYGWVQLKDRRGKILRWLLMGWLAGAALWIHPWHYAYFNELIGGPSGAPRIFTRINLDWGIGLKELFRQLRDRGVSQVYLAYNGSADPLTYGRCYPLEPFQADWARLTGRRDPAREALYSSIDLRKEPRALMALQARFVFEDSSDFAWLRDVPPAFVVAHSIFVYDITQDAEAQRKLAAFFQRKGDDVHARLHMDWAQRLESPGHDKHGVPG